METQATQPTDNITSIRNELLKCLLGEVKTKVLKGGIERNRILSSVLDCCDFLIEYLEGRHE